MKAFLITGAAALAACGVLGMAPAAVQASSASAPNWIKRSTATSPSNFVGASMAYDAATGTVVWYGGGETWTWDGSAWTQQHPAASPSTMSDAAMAYDASTGDVVLFGGMGGHGHQQHRLVRRR